MAAEVDLDGAGLVTGRKEAAKLGQDVRRQVDIDDAAVGVVVKVSVIVEVGAVARRAAIEVDLLHQSAADQSIEAVVNRGQGNGRHEGFYARKYLVDRWVITLIKKNLINDLALGRGAQTAIGKLLGKWRCLSI